MAEIMELEVEVAQRTAAGREEVEAALEQAAEVAAEVAAAAGRGEVEAQLAEAQAALEREQGALAVQAKALQEETLQAPPRLFATLPLHAQHIQMCARAHHRSAASRRTAAMPPW